MDTLYAPWRTEYVSGNQKKCECVFCDIYENSQFDEQYHVLYREDELFIVMNKYPYSVGHFMIIPNLHTNKLEQLDEEIWTRMNILAQRCVKLLKDILHAQGVNIGINIGEVSGAGISEHLHLHLVPRWAKDTNFMTTIANTRVFSTDFEKVYKLLKENILNYIEK
jgi:diadenosine tetraphosphate (Ap4A) HIT family hydrolase